MISVAPRWQGRGASVDERGVRLLNRQWIVETSADAIGEPAVIDAVVAHDPSANLYAPHPHWAWAVCRSLSAEPFQGPRQWLVTARYSSDRFAASGDGTGAGGGAGGAEPNPAQSQAAPANQRPPRLSVAPKQSSKTLEFDVVTGAAVTNQPVGDRFDPPPEVARSNYVFTWEFWRSPAQLDWPNRSLFQDSVNADEFTILGRTYPPQSLLCCEYSIEPEWETGPNGLNFFWAVRVQVEASIEPHGWKVRLLNAGRHRRVGAGTGGDPYRREAIVDGAGQPVAEPVPLGGNGQPLGPGDPFAYVEYHGYIPLPWADLLK